MAVVIGEEEVLAITIPEAIQSILGLTRDILRKNRTMVEYYIYPNPTPSQIEAFQPRLEALFVRVEKLSALNLPNLALVIDDAHAYVSSFLMPVLDQLLNGVHGVEQLFIKHYDRSMEQRKPYNKIYKMLEYREKQLRQFHTDQMRNPNRRPAEQLSPTTRRVTDSGFCRFAIAFANNRDHGRLSQVLPDQITPEDSDRLRTHGGAFLSWDCPGCAFRLKYHVANSISANISVTDDVRSHVSSPEIEYRPTWLVKCHVYQTKASEGSSANGSAQRRSSSTTYGELRRGVIRRQSDGRAARMPSPFFFGGTRRTKSASVEDDFTDLPIKRKRDFSAKYGCPFCFTTGKEYGHMEYSHGRELAEHIAARHDLERQPSGLVLEKYMVGINGKVAQNVHRWDLNIKLRAG